MENIFKTVVGFGGAAITYLYGGWSALLGVLLVFVVIDYLSGVAAAGVEGYQGKGEGISSKVGRIGIARKISIFVIIAIAHLVDGILGDAHFLRDATIFFYLANELISILENVGRIGLPIPEPIKRAVEVLKGKSENNG